jgi:hypothetical protein
MSNDPTPSLPGWQSARLVVLLDTLDGVRFPTLSVPP